MKQSDMHRQVQALREYTRMREELDREITKIQDDIKAEMDRDGIDTITGPDYKITWKVVSANRLDTKALKKAMPEIVERFTRECFSRRFVVA